MYIEGCLIEFVPFSPELNFHTVFLPFAIADTTVFYCVAVTLTKINTVKIAKYQTVLVFFFCIFILFPFSGKFEEGVTISHTYNIYFAIVVVQMNGRS